MILITFDTENQDVCQCMEMFNVPNTRHHKQMYMQVPPQHTVIYKCAVCAETELH